MALPFNSQHGALLTLNTGHLPVLKDAMGPGVDVQPLFLDARNGIWVLKAIFAPGVTLPNHLHTGTVHAFTLKGQWGYVQHPDQPQTANSYLYEAAGSVHQLQTPAENTEATEVLYVVYGANVNFDEQGGYMGVMDAGVIEQLVNHLADAQGHGRATYISAALAA